MIKPIDAARRIHKDKHSENKLDIPEFLLNTPKVPVQSSTVVSLGNTKPVIGYENIKRDGTPMTMERVLEHVKWFKQL